ncbi:IF-2B-domain-containing protein [Fistulina hepatica ATCC 64428]|uniref:Translation initiation factor eIF2B subunit delta n=1 Tax=Fistulina hepatica ATCC 64428 TaxID=1128425 RepID=A0A0D7A7H8_9AGAR|nr:IF-2B-domain-containing protein [Fistulina hepatica ATCC 64428]
MTKAERRELQERQRAAKQAKQQEASSKLAVPVAKQSQKRQQDNAPTATPSSVSVAKQPDATPKSRGLRIFSHFGLPKPLGHVIKGDIHPVVVRLGLQFSEFIICGANARCIATLAAFKSVIQSYRTPPNTTLSRHLTTHLSTQISHLVSARPMSVTMGNAIRQLKLEISGSDIDIPEQDAKDELCLKIDNYIRDRIIMADEVIQELAGKKIKDGDTILVYARSSVVEKVMIRAKEDGKNFSVIVIDSRPLLEGKNLLRSLTSHDIPCTYALLPSLPSLLAETTTVFLGAHSIHTNGAVYSRAGTAMVALLAKSYNIPVLVCCETYKFSASVMLDGFGKNELAPAKFSMASPLSGAMLEVLDPLYDLTPPTCITAVVTEMGLIPPSSINSIPTVQ